MEVLNMLNYKHKHSSCLSIISNKCEIKLKSHGIHYIQIYDFENLLNNIAIIILKVALLKTSELVLDVMDFNSYVFCHLYVFLSFQELRLYGV